MTLKKSKTVNHCKLFVYLLPTYLMLFPTTSYFSKIAYLHVPYKALWSPSITKRTNQNWNYHPQIIFPSAWARKSYSRSKGQVAPSRTWFTLVAFCSRICRNQMQHTSLNMWIGIWDLRHAVEGKIEFM